MPDRFHRSRTKIVATIGPACSSEEGLERLARAGVDVFRLNMAHGERPQHEAMLNQVRRVSQRLDEPLAVLVDLAGPKIRLGELPGGEVYCAVGERFRFVRGEAAGRGDLTATYALLVDELAAGDRVLLADGTVRMVVEERLPDVVVCRVEQPGLVRSRQGVNLPGVKLSAPALGERDREHAVWAARSGADFLGLSFVRAADDVRQLKELVRGLGALTRVIAKIEKPEALANLEAIVAAADGVMVARGDLGVEIDVARMPVAQKEIVAVCHRHQKPVIIATQMLDSMQRSLQPTRAEVTDVANAILDGADACMLSGETAIGQHPREAVEMLHRIALATEPLLRQREPGPVSAIRAEGLHQFTAAVVYGAGHIARQLDARLIVVASKGGATALAVSKLRHYVPAVGTSASEATLRQMCLYWGVTPVRGAPVHDSAALLQYIDAWGQRHGVLGAGDRVLLVRGTHAAAAANNMLIVHEVPG